MNRAPQNQARPPAAFQPAPGETAPPAPRRLNSILATGTVLSDLARYRNALPQVLAHERSSLIVDTGGFIGHSGYYQLGRGAVERRILGDLYDLVVPGGRDGFHHYFEDKALFGKTVCSNLTRGSSHVFAPSKHVTIARMPTLVIGTIGRDAFEAIPLGERHGLTWHDPRDVLSSLIGNFAERHRQAARRSVVLLSHGGWDADIELARDIPDLDIIFSGQCHTPQHGPSRIGRTAVVRGYPRARGYALARPGALAWDARVHPFPTTPTRRAVGRLGPIDSEIAALEQRLSVPIGYVLPEFRDRIPNRAALLYKVAGRMLARRPAHAVILNNDVLGHTELGRILTRGQLAELVPGADILVHAEIDPAVLTALEHQPDSGLFVISGHGPAATEPTVVITTAYLASTCLGATRTGILDSLGAQISTLLTDPRSRTGQQRRTPPESSAQLREVPDGTAT